MQISKVVNHGNVRWRVTVLINGKRKQRFFHTRKDARSWITLLDADAACGGFWGQRTVAERDEIISAFNASREREVPLLEAVLDWQPLVPARSASFRGAVALYLDSLSASSFRPASLQQIRSNLNQLASELDCTPCREVTSTVMEEWFAKRNWKRSTIDGVIAKVGAAVKGLAPGDRELRAQALQPGRRGVDLGEFGVRRAGPARGVFIK